MPEHKTSASEQADQPISESKTTAGQDFVQKIGKVGCVMFTLMLVLYFMVCLSPKSSMLKDYVPPHDSEYYAENLVLLEEELKSNVFPLLPEGVSCELSDETLKIYIPSDNFWDVRNCILDYYDADIFEFIEN